jgi:hypothetical protein
MAFTSLSSLLAPKTIEEVEERRLVEGIILRTSTANGTKITTDGSGLTFEALPSHLSSPA